MPKPTRDIFPSFFVLRKKGRARSLTQSVYSYIEHCIKLSIPITIKNPIKACF